MLDHLGEPRAATRLMRAIELVTERGEALSPDLGGRATTDEMTEAVIGALKRVNA